MKTGTWIRRLASAAGLAVCLGLAGPPCAAQAAAAPATATPAAAAPGAPKPIATAFRGMELGMDRDSVIAALQKDPIFSYRGPEDLSLLPSPNQSLIDVSGTSFVRHGYFQFFEGKLWVMILELNPDRVDHYSIFTSLVAKYGEPNLIDPKEARWEDKSARMALERPLTLRYMDMAVYARLKETAGAKAGARELDRQGFLGGL
jgi:hypothetical protein